MKTLNFVSKKSEARHPRAAVSPVHLLFSLYMTKGDETSALATPSARGTERSLQGWWDSYVILRQLWIRR